MIVANMKDLSMSTPKELAAEAKAAFETLDRVFRDGSPLAAEMLNKDALAEFRQLRRNFARLHADAGDFIDQNIPEIVVMGGGT